MSEQILDSLGDLYKFNNGDKLRILRWCVVRMTPTRFYLQDPTGTRIKLIEYTNDEFESNRPGTSDIIYDISMDVEYLYDAPQYPYMMGDDKKMRWIPHYWISKKSCECGAVYTQFQNLHSRWCPLYKED